MAWCSSLPVSLDEILLCSSQIQLLLRGLPSFQFHRRKTWLKLHCKYGPEKCILYNMPSSRSTVESPSQCSSDSWLLDDHLLLVFVFVYMVRIFWNTNGNVLKIYWKLLTRMKATNWSLPPFCLEKRMKAKLWRSRNCTEIGWPQSVTVIPHISQWKGSPGESAPAKPQMSELPLWSGDDLAPSGLWHPFAAESLWKRFCITAVHIFVYLFFHIHRKLMVKSAEQSWNKTPVPWRWHLAPDCFPVRFSWHRILGLCSSN